MSKQKKERRIRIGFAAIDCTWNPQIHTPPGEAARHDADERGWLPIHGERFADDAGVTGEPALPKLIAQDKHGWRTWLCVVACGGAAE